MGVALRRSVLLLSAILAGGLQAADGNRYMVEMAMWADGEKRGTPIMVVEPNTPSSIEVGGDEGEADWKIELLLEPPTAGERAPTGAIWLHLSVHRRTGDGWEELGGSLLGVPEGETGKMSIVDSPDVTGTPANSIVYLTAQTSLLRPNRDSD